jgi:hypothetical protein
MLRKDLDDLYENGVIGDWCFLDAKNDHGPFLLMFLRYPIKEADAMLGEWWPWSEAKVKGDIVSLPLSGEGHPVWQWDGNREAPTLSPSILTKSGDHTERWHGFLRAGKLETV